MTYLALKHLHMTCVALSASGFCLRALWMLTGSPLLQKRLTRVLPHVVDSLLLASAIGLAVWSGQYPLVEPWLTAKVGGLLVYIVCGSIALKRGKTPRQRALFAALALLALGYIISVALTRQVLPWL